MNFFITGLPRSRTSWFSAFMTSGDVFCWHEAMNGCHTKEELTRRMNLGGYSIVGNSDSGLIYTDFEKRFPDANTVVIHRKVDEVVDSLLDAGIIEPENREGVANMLDDMSSKLEFVEGLHVEFKYIDQQINEIYTFCTGRDMDKNRFKLFQNLSIEPLEVLADLKSYELWMVK